MARRHRTPAERERESRLTRGSRLAKGAWRLARRDRALISLALLAAGAILLATMLAIRVHIDVGGRRSTMLEAALSLPFYYLVTCLTAYFGVAIAAAAGAAYDGNPMSTREALVEAGERRGPVAHWALIAFVVGVAAVEIGDALAGSRIPVGLAWIPWSLAIAFVVPIIADDADSAQLALRRSVRLARRRWREEIGGFLALGFFMFLCGFAAGFLAAWGLGDDGALPVMPALLLIAVPAIVFLLLCVAAQAFAVSLFRFDVEGGSGPNLMDSLEDPPAPLKPSGGWLLGRAALALVGGIALIAATAALVPDRNDSVREEAEAGRFQTYYPVSYGVVLERGAPVVYGDQQVGIVCRTDVDGSNVVVSFEAAPSLAPLIFDRQLRFDRYKGHFYLRIGPPPRPRSTKPV